jgi:predicted dehydrogenase
VLVELQLLPQPFDWAIVGILSTGKIAATFAKDLLIDPASRDVHDLKHTIVAVASRSKEKASAFVKDVCKDGPGIKAYGSYDELYNDQAGVLLPR